MHLLATRPGSVSDGNGAVDLEQSPGDIVVLSAADSELACLAAARARLAAEPAFPSLRLANLLRLGHPMSVDVYVENTLARARLVIVRLLGGRGYWPYGVEQVAAAGRERGIGLAFLPGDDQPDAELAALSGLPPDAQHRLWRYLVEGGIDNAVEFLRYSASLIGAVSGWREPRPLLHAGLYWPNGGISDVATLRARSWRADAPVAALVFYRALVQAGNLAVVDALIEALARAGLSPLPVYVTSLKDPISAATVERLLAEASPDVILNATGFAVAAPGAAQGAVGHSPTATARCCR